MLSARSARPVASAMWARGRRKLWYTPCCSQAAPARIQQRRDYSVRAAGGSESGAVAGGAQLGLFVCSGSAAIAEALCHTGLDWLCIDAQHGAVDYSTLHNILAATAAGRAKRIVRVGGPDDPYGMQQALDLGADGVMVPLVYTPADAAAAVAACKYPPAGRRSVAYPVRAVYRKGVGAPALARYLREANQEVEVWIQIETREAFEGIDDVLAVPGIDCAFLGPADLGFAYGLHEEAGCDLPAMLASPSMDRFYDGVLAACRAAPGAVAPGVFCAGAARAGALAARGFARVGFDTDLNALITYAQAALPAPPR